MCGVIAIFGENNIGTDLFNSLTHLQHRGQDAAGIATVDGCIKIHKGKGLASQVFKQEDISKLTGNYGIAHTRYPTAGGGSVDLAQPCYISNFYEMVLAHNGNLINHEEIALRFSQSSVLNSILNNNFRTSINNYRLSNFKFDTDSEAILSLLNFSLMLNEKEINFFDKICDSVQNLFQILKGSYSVVTAIVNNGIVAFRDPHGIRPLVIGEKKSGSGKTSYIIASEPTMFYALGFTLKRDVSPGEIIYISEQGEFFSRKLKQNQFKPCIFEYVYFARADSIIDDVSVYRARLRMGQNLANKWKQKYPHFVPDVVVPVPYTSNTAALSFAAAFNVRYSEALHKNSFVNRTFITPDKKKRADLVRHKFTPQPLEIRNKKVMIVDDSIVRGTTSKEIIKMIKEHSPKAVYFASAAPPLKHPCYYGINIPTKEELIASDKSIEEIKDYLEVDALLYQTENDLIEAVSRRGEHNLNSPCMACMNGKYVDYSDGNINSHGHGFNLIDKMIEKSICYKDIKTSM